MRNEESRMSLNHLTNIKNKKSENPEINELERLAIKFGRKFKMIAIENNSVYGYIENRKEYLGNKTEYYKYRKLKTKYSLKNEKSQTEEDRAHKSFLESYKL